MATIYYARVDEFWRKEQKYTFLETAPHRTALDWLPLAPDPKHTWLTAGLQADFDTFLPIGTHEAKASRSRFKRDLQAGQTVTDVKALFENFSRGAETTRDAWAYNYNFNGLSENIKQLMILLANLC